MKPQFILDAADRVKKASSIPTNVKEDDLAKKMKDLHETPAHERPKKKSEIVQKVFVAPTKNRVDYMSYGRFVMQMSDKTDKTGGNIRGVYYDYLGTGTTDLWGATMNVNGGEIEMTPIEGKTIEAKYKWLTCYPEVRDFDERFFEYNVTETARKYAAMAMERLEDQLVTSALEGGLAKYQSLAAASGGAMPSHRITATGNFITPGDLGLAKSQFSAAKPNQELVGKNVVMHQNLADSSFYRWGISDLGNKGLEDFNAGSYDFTTFRQLDIKTTFGVAKNALYMLPDQEYVGVMSVAQEIEWEENRLSTRKTTGYICSELIDVILQNVASIVKIDLAANAPSTQFMSFLQPAGTVQPAA